MQAAPKKGWKLNELRQLSRALMGQVFNDTYKLLVPIGKGGMGVVFQAENTRLKNARFAIKVLPAVWATNEINFARFKREAKILAGLRHPNIVQVIDFNKSPEGHPYLVMELLEGQTLHQRLKASAPIPKEELLAILDGLGSALQYAHDHGVIHRDLKPKNGFLVRPPGAKLSVKLLDFGISKLMTTSSMVTPSQWLVMGTASYMSPEQAAGKFKDLDNRSDIFSLASITFECLTGRRPFDVPREGESPFDSDQVLYRICHGQPEDLSALAPDLPPKVGEVLARAHSKDREQRHQRVNELVGDLTSALSAPPPGKRSRRAGLLLSLTGALVAGLLAALLSLHLASDGQERAVAPTSHRDSGPQVMPPGRRQPLVPATSHLWDARAGERASRADAARSEARPGPDGIDAGADMGSRAVPPSRDHVRVQDRARRRRAARRARSKKRRRRGRRRRGRAPTRSRAPARENKKPERKNKEPDRKNKEPDRENKKPAMEGHGPMYDEL